MAHSENIWPAAQSRRNTAGGVTTVFLTRVKVLIVWYTLFVDPLSSLITLMSETDRAWLTALDYIADAGIMNALEENRESKWTQIHRNDALLQPGIVLVLGHTQ